MKSFKQHLDERCWPGHKPVPGKKPYSPGSCVKEDVLEEGRPSQRHPLEGHEYHKKSNAELIHIAKDAHEAAEAMKSHNTQAENKYRDQANDSATVRYWRQKNGMPDWYKKKYGHMKEEVEQIDELKASTLNSYIAKRQGNTANRMAHAIRKLGGKPSKHDVYNKGLKRAQQKIDDKRKKETGMNPQKPRPAQPPAYPLGGRDPASGRSYSEEVELDEMDKSQPSSSRGAEGLALGKKAEPVKTDKVKSDALKALQKQYNKFSKYITKPVPTKPGMKKVSNPSGRTTDHIEWEVTGKLSSEKRTFAKKSDAQEYLKMIMKEEIELDEVAAWQRKEGKNPEGGLNQKGVESYRRENPGSKLQTAVTTKPSKLKPGSKAANRRKSFCARMGGMKRRLTSAKTANDPDSRINKALRKWNC